MRNLDVYLKNKSIDYKKLIEYGFVERNSHYMLTKNILENQFSVEVIISDNSKTSKLIDLSSNEEYVLVDVENSVGAFVGSVREQYDLVIHDIISNCTIPKIFKSSQTYSIINYILEKYDDHLEFLWKKYDNNAIWRNKINNKWYGVLMTISENKLGINSNNTIEVIDLKYYKNEVDKLIDYDSIFPGYHMNKKSWITIKLDGSLDNSKVFELIDVSYVLSLKK